MVFTPHLYVVYVSQNKQQLLVYTALTDWFCKTKVDSVYCTVRTKSLHKTDTFHL
jgi:hypothetical protein